MSDLTFEGLVERARRDERVVGVFLGGSRGKGANVRPESDYDVRLVVTAPVPELDGPRGRHVDVGVMTLDRFRGEFPEWDRYTLTRARALVDKTGEIQRVIDEKGRLSEDETESIPPLALNFYMNSLYRGLKRPAGIGGRLHRAEATGHVLTLLFALEGRLRPFHDYLEWELEHYPLAGWDDLLPLLEGDQRALFRRVEHHVRERGLGDVVDRWEPDVALMRGER
jgi:hypothetical protein